MKDCRTGPYYQRARVPAVFPAGPDYLTAYIPPPELRRATSTAGARPGGRRHTKFYPATFSHAPLELRPVRMKKSFRRAGKSDSVKM